MNKRKGITPIIAIVLLLMMTVAAGGLAWTFIQSTIEGQQTKTEAELEGMGMTKQLEIIQIENNNALVPLEWIVTVRNPGDPVKLDLTNLLMKIDGRLVSYTTASPTDSDLKTGDNTEIKIVFDDAVTEWPDVVDPPVIIELEMNTDYRFSYSCNVNMNHITYC